MSTYPAVELLGYYGGDLEHAMSAWTSTSRDLTDEKRARIPALLKQLADNGHETPFEKSALHFLVECDVATHIHIIKHRIGVSVNGESARYRELSTRHYLPSDWSPYWQQRFQEFAAEAEANYHHIVDELTPILGRKRAKESARYFLTYANVTTIDVQFNFRSFVHFLRLRLDEHAQLEVRQVAQQMLDCVRSTGAFDASLAAFGYGETK